MFPDEASKMSPEDILSVEKQVQLEFKAIDLAVRKQIPIYDKAVNLCQKEIEKYERCMSEGLASPNPSFCLKEEVKKQECIGKYVCPQQFKAYAACLSGDRRLCKPYFYALNRCNDELAEQVRLATKREFAKLREEEMNFKKLGLPINPTGN
ncbi:hypothetical protein DSO57_1001770 [Entomophthora muscae]|uniref:Uncharacterized protein n=1 Tax=Entomophthora muscae TaxID=34485 RepID=A0ACC2T8U4_9FUNG|nr:hypothetical protein DSO57_1001770 [Entomophthora muscae]